MFSKMHSRCNWRSGKGGIVLAAVVCAAGLAIGAGGGTLLAQLSSGNPTPGTEATIYNPCANLVPCSDPSAPLGLCFPAPSSLTVEVPDGTFNPNGYTSLRVGNCGFTITNEPCGEPPVAAVCNNNSPIP